MAKPLDKPEKPRPFGLPVFIKIFNNNAKNAKMQKI